MSDLTKDQLTADEHKALAQVGLDDVPPRFKALEEQDVAETLAVLQGEGEPETEEWTRWQAQITANGGVRRGDDLEQMSADDHAKSIYGGQR